MGPVATSAPVSGPPTGAEYGPPSPDGTCNPEYAHTCGTCPVATHCCSYWGWCGTDAMGMCDGTCPDPNSSGEPDDSPCPPDFKGNKASDDCKGYYDCSGDPPYFFACAGDLLFDGTSCNWPENVECDISSRKHKKIRSF